MHVVASGTDRESWADAMIAGMFDKGAMPALERLMQFTGRRHAVLTNNIANLSTPYFKPRDLDPATFQVALGKAIDRRRGTATPVDGPLEIRDTRTLSFDQRGITARPRAINEGVLFHDENNRDLERTMQRLAENTMVHSAAIEMLRNQFQMLETAIRERV